MFNKIGLMARQRTSGIANTLNALVQYLHTLKVRVIVEQETLKVIPNCGFPGIINGDLSKYCELLIVVGGDGSLLNAARSATQQHLPVIGINRGTLGFLTDILPNKIGKIGEILQGKFLEEQRFLLESNIYSQATLAECYTEREALSVRSLGSTIALNDVVLLAAKVGHLIDFTLRINDTMVCDYRADGLIISTPTGSTAYALAANGPIVHPSLDVLAVVPMFSHNLSSRPIVISANDVLKISITVGDGELVKLVSDGQDEITIPRGGEIVVKKATKKLRLLHPLDYDYFEALRVKLGWER